MKTITEITPGAYFVPSYSEQTVVQFTPGFTQSLISAPTVVEYDEQSGQAEDFEVDTPMTEQIRRKHQPVV